MSQAFEIFPRFGRNGGRHRHNARHVSGTVGVERRVILWCAFVSYRKIEVTTDECDA
jgi:hypothetical protein